MIADAIAIGGEFGEFATIDRPIGSAVFDEQTNTWTVTTDNGQRQTRVLLECGSPLTPWQPDLPGSDTFRGRIVHAAAIGADFDPAAQRIAVVGADSTAGRLIGKLTRAGASVTVFPMPPRRVTQHARRPRRYLRRRPDVVTAPIERVTASDIRTADGARHDADTIIFGTGFAAAAQHHTLVGTGGQVLARTWQNGDEPYYGVAVHGFPNYFILGGPDADAAQRYVADCLQLMADHARIEVRRSSQRVFNERTHLHAPTQKPLAPAFELVSAGAHDDVYDGPATLTLAEDVRQVRVRLTGHVDPIDGQYHWQGAIFDRLPDELMKNSRAVHLAVDGRTASARITEVTRQGVHSIAGVGAPPFALAGVELAVPLS